MTTMYALPALTALGPTPGGWSNTSGGPSNGTYPTDNVDVIFDANSGSARTITGNPGYNWGSLTMTGANAISFSGNLTVYKNVTIPGNVTVTQLSVANGYFGYNTTLNVPNATIGTLIINGTVTLASNLNVTSALAFTDQYDDSSNPITYSLIANGYSITAPTFAKSTDGHPNSVTYTTGGVWTLNGSGNVFDARGFSGSDVTVKLTNTSGTAKTVTLAGGSGSIPSLYLQCNGAGPLSISWGSSSSMTIASLIVGPGYTNVSFPLNSTLTAASFSFVGTGTQPITLTTNTGWFVTFTKTGGGTVYLDYCVVDGINFTPANTFIGRGCSILRGGTNLTLYRAKPNFASFF